MSCGCTEELDHLVLVVDGPGSAIRELLVEDCLFSEITLHALPLLAHLACLGRTVMLSFGSVPRLTDVNLTFWDCDDPLDFLLGDAPAATTSLLLLRFTAPSRWIFPIHLDTPWSGLKRILVADLPWIWEVLWPRMLLLSAPSLEVLHVHVARSDEEPGEEKGWWLEDVRKLRHWHMMELVMLGFGLTPRHMQLVKDTLSVCGPSLQRLVLLRDGHVRYNGLWDWEMVGRPESSPWSVDDRMVVTKLTEFTPKTLVDMILR